MIKNTEDLVKYLEKEISNFKPGQMVYDYLTFILKQLNQFEKPETVEETTRLLENVLKENKRLGKLLEEKHEEWLELMDEINNQEVLSDKWIDEYSKGASRSQYVWVDDLKELLVPKQEITYEDALKAIAENIGTDEFSIGLYLEALNNNEKYEFLTEKWIEDNTSPVDDDGRLYVWKRDLQNVIVPKQEEITEEQAWEVLSDLYDIPNKSYIREAMRVVANYVGDDMTIGELERKFSKPVIPNHVAKWISRHHERFDLYHALLRLENNVFSWEDVYDWYRKNTCKFVNAYLTGEYEVEEEQKYIVVFGKSIYNTTTYGQIGEMNGNKIMQSVYASEENIIMPNQYTKSEILEVKDGEDIFKRYAVKVEEMEE